MSKLLRCFLVVLAALLVWVNPGRSDVIHNIQFSPKSPASFALGQNLNITFDYTSQQSGGIRIFARPFTGGALTPSYAASGSPLYAVGSGSGSGSFTITSGDVVVDHIRFQVYNSDQSALLLEFYVQCEYHFSTNAISNIVMTPVNPAPLQLGENLSITFDYATAEAGGVRIFARPFTGGSLSPGYSASGSPLYSTGTGSGSGSFTFSSSETTVDAVRFQMLNADQSVLLLEFFVPVDYHFASHAISDVQVSPSSPAALALNQNLNISFKYTTNQSGGVRIFPRPFTDGALSPGYGASGSPLYPAGDGSGNGFFTITGGDVSVDSIRFQMYNSDQSALLLEYFVPIDVHFGVHAISNIQFSPSSPAYFTNGENDNSSFDYATNDVGGVRIFPRPFTGGALTPNYGASGSPLYSTGTGSGTGFFNISAGNVLVDQMRFQMWNSGQTSLLLEYFAPVKFYYGNVALTGVDEPRVGAPASFHLSQNYPNPFNPSTQIDYQLPKQSHVLLTVYDMLGRTVATLVDGIEEAGNKSVSFNANGLVSGVYYYRLQAEGFAETKKFLLLK